MPTQLAEGSCVVSLSKGRGCDRCYPDLLHIMVVLLCGTKKAGGMPGI